MMSHILVTPPATEPVTLNEVKAHARLAHDVDDALLQGLLRAARQWAEHYTRRAFITQSWALHINPPEERRLINLPRGPVLGITGIHTLDEDDNATLWDSGNYYLTGSQLVLRDGMAWPVGQRAVGGMVIEYTAGFGSTATSVPDAIRLAIMQLATHWYEHRGEAITGETVSKTPLTVEALLAPYRASGLGVI